MSESLLTSSKTVVNLIVEQYKDYILKYRLRGALKQCPRGRFDDKGIVDEALSFICNFRVIQYY